MPALGAQRSLPGRPGWLPEEHAEADGREQAPDQPLGYCLDMAGAADDHLRALPRDGPPGVFTGREAALPLPLLLAEYFSWQGRFDD